jgi:hypothetical protein
MTPPVVTSWSESIASTVVLIVPDPQGRGAISPRRARQRPTDELCFGVRNCVNRCEDPSRKSRELTNAFAMRTIDCFPLLRASDGRVPHRYWVSLGWLASPPNPSRLLRARHGASSTTLFPAGRLVALPPTLPKTPIQSQRRDAREAAWTARADACVAAPIAAIPSTGTRRRTRMEALANWGVGVSLKRMIRGLATTRTLK